MAEAIERVRDGRLTVVMPTYNHSRFLRAAIDSVVAQTRRPDRLLVIDDASTDETPAILAACAAQHPWIEVVTNAANRGVIANLNAGLAAVDSEYVTFLASDDLVMPTLYEKTVGALAARPDAALCAVAACWIDSAGRPVRQPRLPFLGAGTRYLPPGEIARALFRHGSIFAGNGTVYVTAQLRAAGGFDAQLGALCDGYVIQLLSLAHGACYVPEPLAAWRRSDTSFAAVWHASPAACRQMMAAVTRHLLEREGAAFPPAYRRRFERRIRYAVASAAVAARCPDVAVLNEALGASWDWLSPVLRGTRRICGRRVPLLMLLVTLRPWDLFPAISRRLTIWPAGMNSSGAR